MGAQKVSSVNDKTMQDFIRALLRDVRALSYMLEHDWFETDTIRIGAEQEMCLVNKHTLKPAMIAVQALKKLKDHPWCGTEIAQFNLENNLSPLVFTGDCFSKMQEENELQLDIIRKAIRRMGARVVLTGILPTLRKFDLDLQNLTPKDRYLALIEAINRQNPKKDYELRLMGIDEISVKHDSPLLEACNTSYQVHLQVTPQTFVPLYNIAQVLAAPIMGLAANSPIVFGRRLWHETRIALFQQALDTRATTDHMRQRSPRVNFGNGWLEHSLPEIYREDIARFRVLLGTEIEENSLELIAQGKVPKLQALQVHNSTVYRWNRPCYGISDNGKPHLRIENRVLPAGPSVLDQVANAAFWLGAMTGMANRYPDIRAHIGWADVRDNFVKSARFGIDTKFTWFNNQKIGCVELIRKELLPIAREGLESRGVDTADIDKYLGVIEERATAHTNGARWQLRAYTKLMGEVNRDEALSVLTSCIIKNQESGEPVHKWKMPTPDDLKAYVPAGLKVEEFMETDLFTAYEEDSLELVTDILNWRRLRYIPVENNDGRLVGLITTRLLLRYYTLRDKPDGQQVQFVRDIMIKAPLTIGPRATIVEAMNLMRDNRIGCLPVVSDGDELIGIITEMDFLRVSGRLIARLKE
jgi:CBS domain-containing protein/gamma-glutamylcysteine synthetase